MKVKYVHIFYRKDIKFNLEFVKLLNNHPESFNIDEHLFVTPYLEVYDNIKNYVNAIFDSNGKNLVNKYGETGKWIIAHSFNSVKEILTIKNRFLGRVIWRYWGGGITGFQYESKQILQNSIKKILNYEYKKKVSGFRAIGIANVVDILDVHSIFPQMQTYGIAYVSDENMKSIDSIKKNNKKMKDETINVVVGHRGGREGNHIEILKNLRRFESKNMSIFVPLSYGDQQYIEEVKACICNEQFKNVSIIDSFMKYDEYCEFLNKMDIGIYDGLNSYALGNISLMLTFGKKVILNKEGILKTAFDYDKVPCGTTNELSSITYEEFIKAFDYSKCSESTLFIHNIQHYIDELKRLFNSLDDEI